MVENAGTISDLKSCGIGQIGSCEVAGMVRLLQQIAAQIGPENISRASTAGKIFRSQGVLRSKEFDRILALPRRNWEEPLTPETIDEFSRYFKTPHGTMTLRPVQVAGLIEAHDNNGGLIQAGVGKGKTLMSLLMPVAMRAIQPLLIVPAKLKKRTLEKNIPELAPHWVLHPTLQVMSYEELSRETGAEKLDRLAPDLIICDEAHKFRHPRTARTKRFLRYFKAHTDTRLVIMSGTITRKSVKDYWHLLRLCLPHGCPLPLHWLELNDWADALDVDTKAEKRLRPGALLEFCESGEDYRSGFRRRLYDTPGIIITQEGSCDASLILSDINVDLPESIEQAIYDLYATWQTPDEDIILYQLDLWRHARELASGFFYRWVWPIVDGKPVKNQKWLLARKEWRGFCRQVIGSNRSNIDTEMQVARACKNGHLSDIEYQAWQDVKDEYDPISECVWVDDFLVHDAAKRLLHAKAPTLCWVEHKAFGAALAALTGLPCFGAGTGEQDILRHEGKSIILMTGTHSEGANLQPWSQNLVVSASTSGSVWEQMLGRTHRDGQLSDEVNCEIYFHTDALMDGFKKAYREAQYIQHTTGTEQKLLNCDMTFDMLSWSGLP